MLDWVSDKIQNVKFEKSKELKKTGCILEFYDTDNKLDVQLYDSVEDGRHIVTMDLPKKKLKTWRKELFVNSFLINTKPH